MIATKPAPKAGLRGSELALQIRKNPEWFARRVLGADPWDKQVEIVRAVLDHNRVAVRGCVASTKTFAIAMAALTWLCAYPGNSRVFSMAPSFRQVDKNIWGYLRRLVRMAEENGAPLGCEVFKEPRIEFGDDWYYNGFSTKDPHNVHGLHGENDLIILDDAHGIPKEITDELENMMAGGNTHILMAFNPIVLSGETYDCNHSQKAIWKNIKISFDDLKKVYAKGRQLPGALQPATVATWRKKFGPKSSFCLAKIDAEYPKEEKDSVVPLSWIEAAMEREVPQLEGEDARLATFHGQDVARFGDDESARCAIVGRQTKPVESWQGARTTETAGKLIAALSEMGGIAAVDVIGMGSGVVDQCHAEGVEVMAVNVSEASTEVDETGRVRFANLRSEIWWGARVALDPENADALALSPEDQELAGELCSVKWKTNAQGRIQVESKDEMKKRLGHSPDKADAFCLAVYARHQGAGGGGYMNNA